MRRLPAAALPLGPKPKLPAEALTGRFLEPVQNEGQNFDLGTFVR